MNDNINAALTALRKERDSINDMIHELERRVVPVVGTPAASPRPKAKLRPGPKPKAKDADAVRAHKRDLMRQRRAKLKAQAEAADTPDVEPTPELKARYSAKKTNADGATVL
jgi:hypothetical protein